MAWHAQTFLNGETPRTKSTQLRVQKSKGDNIKAYKITNNVYDPIRTKSPFKIKMLTQDPTHSSYINKDLITKIISTSSPTGLSILRTVSQKM